MTYDSRRMSVFKIDFETLDWQPGRPGVRYKEHREGSRQIRLVLFETGDGFVDWCQHGHIGYVLSGGLELDINGTLLSFSAGDGLFIPPGESSRHRAASIVPGTRLLMVEDVEP